MVLLQNREHEFLVIAQGYINTHLKGFPKQQRWQGRVLGDIDDSGTVNKKPSGQEKPEEAENGSPED
jgi:hypothetical protein